jgi:Family of unknown function (DUF5996)
MAIASASKALPANEAWPALPLNGWADTYATLHRWTQVVGKVRLARTPWVNHSWHVPLYVTARGLTTGLVPHDRQSFEIDFDFVDHRLSVRTTDGATADLDLRPRSVAAFYREVMQILTDLSIGTAIHPRPNELADATPFADDEEHAAYDPDAAHRFWRVLVQADRVFTRFRAKFVGKCSPVHFFWGSFDLAVTRFSGRPAPTHPGGVPNLPDSVVREAYSHEVSSAGFWPGGGAIPYPAFYSYAYPEPAGFSEMVVRPAAAFYSRDLHEFVLPYDAVRTADQPDAMLLAFLEDTYRVAADLGKWDRTSLEKSE